MSSEADTTFVPADEPGLADVLTASQKPGRKPKERRSARGKGQNLSGWALVAPSLVVIGAFTLYPIVKSLILSFSSPTGVGLAQYDRLINDPVFWKAFWNNMVYAVIVVVLSVVISLGMALWVNGKLKGRAVLRLAYFSPTILPLVAAGSIWLFFYTPGYGPVDMLFKLFGAGSHNWLGDPDTVLPAIMAVTIWKEAGLFMVFYLAGLQNMSSELQEASVIEGASRWYHFRRVTFPLLMPTTLFVLIVSVANAFKQVDQIFVMTDGGPNNSSMLLLYYIYKVAFTFYDEHYAAVLTVILVAALLSAAILQFKFLDKRTHYQ